MIAFKVKSKTLPTIIKHVLQRGNAKETNALPKCFLLTSQKVLLGQRTTSLKQHSWIFHKSNLSAPSHPPDNIFELIPCLVVNELGSI